MHCEKFVINLYWPTPCQTLNQSSQPSSKNYCCHRFDPFHMSNLLFSKIHNFSVASRKFVFNGSQDGRHVAYNGVKSHTLYGERDQGLGFAMFTSPSYIQPGNQDHYLSSLHKSCFPLTVWSSFHIHHQLYFFSFAEQPTTQSHILLARQIEEKHSNGIALLYYMANQKASLKEYSVTYAHLISDIAHH